MKPQSAITKDIPLKVVGGCKFGRFPKISSESTTNMIVSDGWLVNFAGYKSLFPLNPNGEGRGIYSSTRFNHMFCVIGNKVFSIDSTLGYSEIGIIETSQGDVFIAENNGEQIAICDQKNLYIYNYRFNTFIKASIDFTPGYIAFQDGYFISVDTSLNALGFNNNQWRLSQPNEGLEWPPDSGNVGQFQTKVNKIKAAIPFPSKAGLIFVLGDTCGELWQDNPLPQNFFPYARNSYINIDYGTANPATIGFGDQFIVWLAINEKSGPVIMYSDGGAPKPISTDGIDFLLARISAPSDSVGFIFKQDGHVLYILTFTTDNITLMYDFNTELFFFLCDENYNYFPVRKVAFFNDSYYFVNLNDGDLYELSTDIYTLNGVIPPRWRFPPPAAMPDGSQFITNSLTITLEQGVESFEDPTKVNPSCIDLSISVDGGEVYGNVGRQNLNPLGKRRNRFTFWQLGMSNDMRVKLDFIGNQRFAVYNGILSVYQ